MPKFQPPTASKVTRSLWLHWSKCGFKSFKELLCPWDSPGENTGVGCDALLQEIFLTQGSNPCLTVSPVLAGRFFTTSATWEALLWSAAAAAAKSLQSCPALSDPIDGSPLGSSVPGISFFLWSQIRSDQISCSVVSDSLRPHESQHARPPCPSPTPGVHSDSCPSSQ